MTKSKRQRLKQRALQRALKVLSAEEKTVADRINECLESSIELLKEALEVSAQLAEANLYNAITAQHEIDEAARTMVAALNKSDCKRQVVTSQLRICWEKDVGSHDKVLRSVQRKYYYTTVLSERVIGALAGMRSANYHYKRPIDFGSDEIA